MSGTMIRRQPDLPRNLARPSDRLQSLRMLMIVSIGALGLAVAGLLVVGLGMVVAL
jgi:hypothetical protein